MKTRSLIPLLWFAVRASAQYTDGYLFVAPGGETPSRTASSAYSAGFGIEQRVNKSWGFGPDFEGVVPGKGKASNSVGIISFEAFTHLKYKNWPDSQVKWDPFVFFGYSFTFSDFTANGYAAGLGVNYWFPHSHHALRLEGRAQGAQPPGQTWVNYWTIRIGFTFGQRRRAMVADP